jgi:hypothetical protein
MDTDTSYNSINYPELAQQVEQAKATSPELQAKPHKEVVSHVLQQHFAPKTETPESVVGTTTPQDERLPAYAQDASPEAKQKVQHLIELTLDKGIHAGMKEAQQCGPFVMDMFHDALVDKLVQELAQRDLL